MNTRDLRHVTELGEDAVGSMSTVRRQIFGNVSVDPRSLMAALKPVTCLCNPRFDIAMTLGLFREPAFTCNNSVVC